MPDPERLLELLLDLPQLYAAQLSAGGRALAWVWNGVDPAPSVWARTPAGRVERMSHGEDEVFLLGFVPGERGVVYETDLGDERTTPWARPWEGAPERIGEAHPPYFPRGAELHPERPWVFFGANYDFARGKAIEPTWVWRRDLKTGELRALARPERPGTWAPQLSPDGRWVLYDRGTRHPGGQELWLVGADGEGDRLLVSAGEARKVYGLWAGARVNHVAEAEGTRVWGWLEPDGRGQALLEDPYLEYPLRLGGTPLLAAQAVRRARSYTLLAGPQSGAVRELRPPSGSLTLLGQDAGGWVGVYASSTRPADLVRLDPDALEPEAFTSLTGLDERLPAGLLAGLVPAEDFEWTSTDGLPVHGFVYRTPHRPRGTIVLVHGGPTAHYGEYVSPEVQYYLARGFNVFLPNYRGSTGYGLAFQQKIKETGWGGLEQDDIRTGIEALITTGLAEPGRVGVTGTSYGGYSSWWQITHAPPELVAAAAPICGMTDLVVDYYSTRPDLRPYSEEMLGGSPEEVPERYHERSPVHYVNRIRGRLLIVQGALDPNVTPENLTTVRRALDAAGVPYELLVFEDEGHGIRKKENRRTLYRRLADFFEAAFAKG
ncbi:S9 family peptidase [Oceanithermus sp.]